MPRLKGARVTAVVGYERSCTCCYLYADLTRLSITVALFDEIDEIMKVSHVLTGVAL